MLKDELCKLPEVAYCGLSVSGNGYWVLIPVSHPEKHSSHFNFIEQYFRSKNLYIDMSCRDVGRLRFFSYDPDAYINHSAATLYHYSEKENSTATSKTPCDMQDESSLDNIKVRDLIDQICTHKIDLTSKYDTWVSLAYAFANTFNEKGRAYFHSVSQYHPTYDFEESDSLFSKCLGGRNILTISTFYYLCRKVKLVPSAAFDFRNVIIEHS